MGIKLNLKYVDQRFISHKVKNPDSGRKWTEIQCPLCQPGLVYPVRDIVDHIERDHARRKQEAYAKLFGVTQMKCDCGRDLMFNTNLGIFPRKCNSCQGADLAEKPSTTSIDLLVKGKSSKEIEELIEFRKLKFAEEMEALKGVHEKKLESENFSRIDLKSLRPRLTEQVKVFLKKFTTDMRPLIASNDQAAAFELLNYMDSYIKDERWKEVVKND